MATTLVVFSLAVVAASVAGGALPLATILTHTRLQLYLSFSAGTMLGSAFLHMLPEAVAHDPRTAPAWAVVGLLAVFFLERFFAFHHHESPADPGDPCPAEPHEHAHHKGHSAGLVDARAPGQPGRATKSNALQWKVALVGLVVHGLAGGVALASGTVSTSATTEAPGAAAWGVFLATVVHKPADALTLVTLMLRAGTPRWIAHCVNLAFALVVPLGVVVFLLGLRWIGPSAAESATSAALAFSAGTFLCIALSDLLPELQFHAHDRVALSAALVGGVGLMALVGFWA